jgi:nucleotide-binding universal stress UspA family protein
MTQQTGLPSLVAPAFASIVCGVDGSRPSFEAARQAGILAGDSAKISYVAISWEQGYGPNAVAKLSHARADAALRRVREESRHLPVKPSFVRVSDADATGRLMELTAGHDLLVVGIHLHTRAAGIVMGETAATIVHRSPLPVLVARRPPADSEFPQDILLAIDGSPTASHAAAEAAARIAHQHGSRVAIIADPAHDEAHRRELADDAATIVAATGTDPVILDAHGALHRAVATAASDLGSSLVVCGSRGLHGFAALGSTSERIAHAAPCSVLILRPRA